MSWYRPFLNTTYNVIHLVSGILLKGLNLLNNTYLHEMRDKIGIIYKEVFTCKKRNTLV